MHACKCTALVLLCCCRFTESSHSLHASVQADDEKAVATARASPRSCVKSHPVQARYTHTVRKVNCIERSSTDACAVLHPSVAASLWSATAAGVVAERLPQNASFGVDNGSGAGEQPHMIGVTQVRQGMLWMWGDAGPSASIDAAAKTPAINHVRHCLPDALYS